MPGLPVTELPVNFAIHVYDEPTLVYCNSVFSFFVHFPTFTPYYTTIKKSINVFNWHVLL